MNRLTEELSSVLRQRGVCTARELQKCVDPPWAHFTSDFIWFHRPLSDYWKAFKAAGFELLDLEEPRLCEERSHLAPNARKRKNSRTRPYSIAFNLKTH